MNTFDVLKPVFRRQARLSAACRTRSKRDDEPPAAEYRRRTRMRIDVSLRRAKRGYACTCARQSGDELP
ncbi:hypothetical protein KCP78_25745 [Salmonella enterica subsp. enterica]|nr:hypothetical protein KCP78_25745 [Salmonella enterica subsp. enterica]